MPENKKTFKVGSDTYDIEETQVEEFLKDVPNAVEVKSFIVDKDTFDIPLNDVNEFLSDVPNAKPLYGEGKDPIAMEEGEGAKVAKGGVASALGKPQAEPIQSGGSGSAMKMSSAELQSQLPTTLTAQDVKSQIEQSVPQAEMLGLDYEAIAKQSKGKSQEQIANEIKKATVSSIINKGVKKESQGAVDMLAESVLRGSSRLGESLANTPAFIYDIAAMPQNYIAEKFDMPWLKVSSEETAELMGLPENEIANYYSNAVAKSQEKFQEKYDKGITDYISKGEYTNAFGMLANQIAESAPVTISLMMGNAAGISTSASIVGSGTVFGAQKKKELDEEAPWMSEPDKINAALMHGFAEGIFEQFGLTKIGSVVKNVFAKEGKDVAADIAKKGFIEVYGKILRQYLGTSAEEALSEAATQYTQNAIDKYSGAKPDIDLMEGVADAFLVGFGAGSMYGSVPTTITTIKTKKARQEQQDIQSKREPLTQALQSENIAPAAKGVIAERLKQLNGEEADIEIQSSELVNSLPQPTRDRLNALQVELDEINVSLEGAELAPEVRSILEEKASQLDSEKDLILDAEVGTVEGKELTQPEDIQQEQLPSNPLKDVESTKSALAFDEYGDNWDEIRHLASLTSLGKKLTDEQASSYPEGVTEESMIAEEYHKAKADGSNPELVKEVKNYFERVKYKNKYLKDYTTNASSFLARVRENLVDNIKLAEDYKKQNTSKTRLGRFADKLITGDYIKRRDQFVSDAEADLALFDKSPEEYYSSKLKDLKERAAKGEDVGIDIEFATDNLEFLNQERVPESEETVADKPNVESENVVSKDVEEVIGDKEYTDFIDNNKVSDGIIESIAQKVADRTPLSERETAIFSSKTGDVNKIIADKFTEEQKSDPKASEQVTPTQEVVETEEMTDSEFRTQIGESVAMGGINGLDFRIGTDNINREEVENWEENREKFRKSNEPFTYIVNRKGKRFIVAIAGLNDKVGLANSGREGSVYTFIEITENLPANAEELLLREAIDRYNKTFKTQRESDSRFPTHEFKPEYLSGLLDRGKVQSETEVSEQVEPTQEEVTQTPQTNAEEQQSGALRNESEQVQTEGAVDSNMPVVNEAELQNRETVAQETQVENETEVQERPDQEIMLEGVQETGNEGQVRQGGEQLRTEESQAKEVVQESKDILNEYSKQEVFSIIRNNSEKNKDYLGDYIGQEKADVDGGQAIVDLYQYGKIQRIISDDGSKVQRLVDLGNSLIEEPLINLTMSSMEAGKLFKGKDSFSLSEQEISKFFNKKFSDTKPDLTIRLQEKTADPFEALSNIANELGEEVKKEVGKDRTIDDDIKDAKQALKDIFNEGGNLGVVFDPKKEAARQFKLHKQLVNIAKLYVQKGLKTAQEFALELGLKVNDVKRAWDEAIGGKAITEKDLEQNPYDSLNIKDAFIGGKEKESKFGGRVQQAYKDSPLYQKAAKFLDPTYTQRKQDAVAEYKDEVKKIFPDKADQRDLALDSTMPPDVKAALLGDLFKDAKDAYDANPTQENLDELTKAKADLQNFGTGIGQGVSYFQKIYEMFPELQVEKLEKELDEETERAMGKSESKNTANDLHKAKKVRDNTLDARTDVFNAIGNALQGLPSFLSNITDGKVRQALKTLLNFGKLMDANQKELLSGFIARVKESGQLAVAQTRQDVESLVRENLSDINGRLKNPYSPKDFNRVVDAFMELYENLATTAINDAIESQFPTKKFSISRNKNSKIAKLILYGALDDVELRRKFALKYDIPFISDNDAKKLQDLAQRVDRAKGGSKKLAQRELDTYIAKIKRGQSPLAKVYNKYLNIANDLGSFIINNILFNIATPALALTSNMFRLGAAVGKYAVTGQFDVLKFAFRKGLNKEVELADGKKRRLSMNPVIDAVLAALGGIPRLSEYSLQGVSVQEAKTRRAKTKTERVLRRAFLTPSSRLFSALDAAVTPYYSAMDSYSTYKKLIKEMYREAGNKNVDNVTLDQDVKSIIGFNTSNFDEIANQAYDDVMNSTLMQDLIAQGSWDANNEFPDANSRRSLNSAAAQIYNEYITRIYEIYNEGFNQRFFELQNRKDALGRDLFDPTKNYSPELRDIDKFIAKNTNEIAFFGTPPGTFGLAAEITGSIGNAIPFFKYSGYFPIFNNAMWNAAAYSVKMYAGLNLIQYASYKATGRRRLLMQKPFDTKFAINLDQQNMAVSAAVSSAMAVALGTFLSNLYDTPEEEKDALKNGNWTGAVTRLTSAQRNTFRDANGDQLKEGMFYYKGFPSFPYNKTPLHGIFEAGAYNHNSNLFNADYRKTDLFLEEDRESTAWEATLSYLANGIYISFETTSAKQMSDVLNSILSINPDQVDDSKAESLAKDLENKMSGLASNLIPYNKLQKQVADFFYTKDGFNKKRANTFMDKILVKTAFSNYILKSNATDPFGRPLTESWDVQGLTMGFNTFELKGDEVRTILDVVYEKDPYMQSHISHNYGYNAPHTLKTWVQVDVENLDPTEIENQRKELKEAGIKSRIPENEKPKTTEGKANYYEYILNVEDEEINLINEAMGKTVKEFMDVDGNMQILNGTLLTNKGYKDLMNMVYEYGKQKELYRLHKNELGDAYESILNRKLESIRKYAVGELEMTLPENWQ